MKGDKVRRARLVLIFWWVTWPLYHLGLIFLPDWFFQHILVALSVYAIVATKQDDYHTIRTESQVQS